MSRDREFLLLHAEAEALHLMRVRTADRGVRLAPLCTVESEGGAAQGCALLNQAAVDAVSDLLREQRLCGSQLVIAIGGAVVTPSFLELPPLDGKALKQAVALKLEQQLHFPMEEALVAVASSRRGAGKTSEPRIVHATAARREVIDAAVRFAAANRMKLSGICAVPDALAAAAANATEPGLGLTGVLHFDERQSTLVVLADGAPIACADITVSASDLTSALMRPIISGDQVFQIDAPRAGALRAEIGIPRADDVIESLGITGDRVIPLLEPVLQKLAKQLTQWLTFISTSQGRIVGEFQIVGIGGGIKGLDEAIASRTNLKITRGDWFDRLVEMSDSRGDSRDGVDSTRSDAHAAAVAGICAAAALSYEKLPDLVPPEVRQDQRIHGVRRSVLTWGPVVAAACLALGVAFAQLASAVRPARKDTERRLVDAQIALTQLTNVVGATHSLRGREKRFEDFAASSPNWAMLFKELSLLLPPELQATEYRLESRPDGMALTVQAAVFVDGRGRDFDEVVRQALLLLQRSALFKRVELVSANRGTEKSESNLAGELSIQLDLAFVQFARGA